MIKEPGLTLIVKTVTRLTVGIILLYGIYIILHGHLTPGGGFAGGVIIALAYINLMLAFGKDVAFKKLSNQAATFLESFAGILFLTIAVLGFLGGSFFLNVFGTGKRFMLFSAMNIVLSNIAIAFKVGTGLFAVIVVVILAGSLEKK